MEQPNPRVAAARLAAARPMAARPAAVSRLAAAVPALPIRRRPTAGDGPVPRSGEA